MSGSKSLKKEIETMPKWLRPTAGFGIGLQSVFLVVDRFEIETNDGAEKLAATAHSNQTGGYLQIKKNGKRPFRGTTIRVVLGPEKFDDMRLGNRAFEYWVSQYDPMKNENYVNELMILDEVQESYPVSIFPIAIESTASSIGQRKLSRPLPVCNRFRKEDGWQEKGDDLIRFEKDHLKLEVWDKKEFVYVKFEISPEMRIQNSIRFKGVQVRNGPRVGRDFLNAEMDVYGLDTKECLELSRSKLTSVGEDKVCQVISDVRNRYFEILFEELNHLQKGESFGSSKFGLYEFWQECSTEQKQRITEDQIKALVKGETPVIKRGKKKFELQSVPLKDVVLLGENVFFVNEERFQDINGIDQEAVNTVCQELQKASKEDPSLNNIMIPVNEKLINTSRECYKKSIRRVGDFLLMNLSLERVQLEIDEGSRKFLIEKLSENSITKGRFFYGNNARLIIPALPNYAELGLSKVPRGVGGTLISRCGAILSPFDREQAKLAETESCDHFIAVVMASDAFQNAVQWTIDHPANDEKRTPEMVKRAYEKLMREYFDVLRPKDDQ